MFLFYLLFSWERPIIRMCTRHFQSSNQRYLFVQTHTLSTSSPHPVLFESQGPYAVVLPPPFPPVSSLPHLSQTEMWRRGVGGKMRMRGVEVFSRHPQCICHDILILLTVKRRFFPHPFFQFFCTSLKTCPHGKKKSRDSLPRSHSAPKPKGRKATTTLLKQVLPQGGACLQHQMARFFPVYSLGKSEAAARAHAKMRCNNNHGPLSLSLSVSPIVSACS